MARIDITLDKDIAVALTAPEPAVIKLPCPKTPVRLRLPGGAQIHGIGNITEKIPDDCTFTFSLLAQLGPILGNFKCFFDVLSLLKPLIEIIGGLAKVPPQPPSPAIIEDFAKAAAAVSHCIVQFTTPLGLAQFIIDILDLILKVLNCVLDVLQTVLSLLEGISLDLVRAREAGNLDLIAALEVAESNALSSACAAMTPIEPIGLILGLINPLMEIVGGEPIELPTIAAPEEAAALGEVVDELQKVVDGITTVRNAIPLP